MAEDIAKDVFIKILSNADSYKMGRNPRAWIMRITRRFYKCYSIDTSIN